MTTYQAAQQEQQLRKLGRITDLLAAQGNLKALARIEAAIIALKAKGS